MGWGGWGGGSSHSLVHYPNARNNQGWTRMKPGARNPSTWASIYCLPGALAWSSIRSRGKNRSQALSLNMVWHDTCSKITPLNSDRRTEGSRSAASTACVHPPHWERACLPRVATDTRIWRRAIPSQSLGSPMMLYLELLHRSSKLRLNGTTYMCMSVYA